MRLPEFIRLNSPYKMQAQKLLHQYIVNKPIEKFEHIGLFFSDDASFSNVNPIYTEVYGLFLRYHKRQLNNLEFGIGTNGCQNKMNKERYGVMTSMTSLFE